VNFAPHPTLRYSEKEARPGNKNYIIFIIRVVLLEVMGRRRREEETEQLTAQVPVGGVARANVLADKLSGGNRSRLVWALLESLEGAVERGADLETVLTAIRSGEGVDEQIQSQARIGRAVVEAVERVQDTESGRILIECGMFAGNLPPLSLDEFKRVGEL
jgi:hypothetical protein